MFLIEGHLCPFCGLGYLQRIEVNEILIHKGEEVELKGLKSWRCNVCAEEILEDESVAIINKKFKELREKSYNVLRRKNK